MNWRRFAGPLRLVISLSLMAYLIWQANPAHVWQQWQNVNTELLGLAILLQFAGVALSAYKWGLILRTRGQGQPYRWLLESYLAGQFANNILPTTIGGDALRVTQLGRRIGSYSQASASVFMERLTGFLALAAIANGAIIWAYFDRSGMPLVTPPLLRLLTVGFTLAAIGALVASFSAPALLHRFGKWVPKFVRRPLEKVTQALADYAPQGRAMAQVLLVSFAFQLLWVGIHAVCGLSLGIRVPLLMYALLATITDIVGLAPFFVNNLGAREVVFSAYLAQVGIDLPQALAFSFLIFTVRLVVSLLGGLVLLWGGADLSVDRPQPAEVGSSER